MNLGCTLQIKLDHCLDDRSEQVVRSFTRRSGLAVEIAMGEG